MSGAISDWTVGYSKLLEMFLFPSYHKYYLLFNVCSYL